ncbi:MAG: glycosyltransferase [Pseudomonadota bacterium]
MSETGQGNAAHIVVLAYNSLARDTRILKQIATLTAAGYRVTALALTDETDTAHDLSDPDRHIYRVPLNPVEAPQPPDDWQLAEQLYGGPVAELLDTADEAFASYRDLRRAIGLLRVGAFLKWSAAKRAAGRQRLKALRLQLREMMFDQVAGATRLGSVVWYETAVRQFCASAPEWRARLDALGPPAVIHAHDLYTLGAGAFLAHHHGAKLVYDAHEYEPERNPPLPPDQRRVIQLLEDRVLSHASGLITVSESIVRLYQRRKPGLDVRLVQNCPDLRAAVSDVPGLRERTGLARDVPLMVFVGLPKLDSRGLRITLDALALLPEVHMAVIGQRWKQEDRDLMAAARAAGLENRIHLLDPVAPEDVITAIRDADVSTCLIQDSTLSYRFSMPNKLFEALLAGVPTIVSDLPDMGGLIRRLEVGLVVDQTDPEAIAGAVRRILADRKAFVPSGPARMELENDCSWAGQETVLLEFYRTLVPGSDNTRS